ncbi:hypothetical protein C4564_01645 [Candidatus Microgenomates bacterium]|nr:MAG: hypothetical protein C4564_01645 [Candidatus Microgenomates bacterium]
MQMGKISESIIAFGFYGLFLLTPLLFNPSRTFPSFELFEWNKMLFVYTMTTIISAAWFVRMIVAKKILLQKTAFDIPLVLFLLSQIIATLFSIDPHVSIFGYYSRFHGGLLSTICYTLLFYAFVSNRDVIKISKLITAMLITGSLVAGYGILEKFGIDAHMWVQDVQARVFSTFGQPNWLAAYLIVLLPLTIYQLFNVSKKLRNGDRQIQNSKFKIQNENARFKISASHIYWIIAIVLYVCLLFTKSRSGFLGFWVGNFVFVGLLFFKSKETFRQKYLKTLLIFNFSLLILNFIITTPISQYNRIATVEAFNTQQVTTPQEAPIGTSVIEVGITDSGDLRRIVWKGAVEIIKNYPLFGTGPETFAFAYYKFRPVEHNLTSEWDFLYNRAHNEFLNIAATSGLIGLGSYLFLIGMVYVMGLKMLFVKDENKSKLLIAAILGSYTAMHVSNFFGFSVVMTGLFFFLLPAIVFAVKPVPTTKTQITNGKQLFFISTVLIVALLILRQVVNFWIADSYYAQAANLRRQGYLEEAHQNILHAVALRPGEPVFIDEQSSIASGLFTTSLEAEDATAAAKFSREALAASNKTLTISRQNVNFWKNRTRVLYDLSLIAPEFTTEALESLTIARELAPTDAKIAYNMAILLGEAERFDEAIAELDRAIALKPDYRDVYIAQSIYYEQQGNTNAARKSLKLVLERINPDDEEVKTRITELEGK